MIKNWLNSLNTVRALQLFQLFRFGVALLVGIVLVQLGMTKEDVSRYEYFLFVAAFLSFFWVNGVLKTMMSYYNKYEEEEKKSLLSHAMILLVFIAVVVCIVGYFVNLNYSFITHEQYGLLSLFILFTMVGAMDVLILVLKNRAKTILGYGLILYSIQLVVMVWAIYVFRDVDKVLLVLVLWSLLRFVYSLFLLRRYGSRAIDWSRIWMLFLVSLPLIGESLSGNAMEYIDGALVKVFFDESLFGVYRYGARELPISTIFVGAISTAIIPIMVSQMKGGLTQMKLELSKLMRWLYPLSIVLMLLSPFLFTWVYSEAFLLSAKVFNIYLLVVISRVLMPHVILISKQENGLLLKVSILELVLNFTLSIILLHWIGIIGIPLASLIAYLVNKLILVYLVYRKFGISLREYFNVREYLIYSVILIISYFVSIYYI